MEQRISNYANWDDSLLSKKITNEELLLNLKHIWQKAQAFYPRNTWPGWIDHSQLHILRNLRNLDRLIPEYVFESINEDEAFILIASILLHDIGMMAETKSSLNIQYLNNIRKEHGKKSVAIIKTEFNVFFDEKQLAAVCEIVENHHGEFNPESLCELTFDIRAAALWVRLADELDFGPGRAPNWLFDYIIPDEDKINHWIHHNNIEEPAIDIELFRVQIRGITENNDFIRKLRDEFESPVRQDLQKIFLNRGTSSLFKNKTFLIWDCTKILKPVEDDLKEIDLRFVTFSNEQYFIVAKHLYNLAKFEISIKLFEEGLNQLSIDWSQPPAQLYFYYYLKALNGMGKYDKAVEIAKIYERKIKNNSILAAVKAAKGLSYWKLGNLNSAIKNLNDSINLYVKLSSKNIRNKVNLADAQILLSIVYLEKARLKANNNNIKKIKRQIKAGIEKAEILYSEYEKLEPEEAESHYKGRYYGLKAFYKLFEIDLENDNHTEWYEDAYNYSLKAYGGNQSENRNPFGILAGKYCAAAINFHYFLKFKNQLKAIQHLEESAELINGVMEQYNLLYDSNLFIKHLSDKIFYLYKMIYMELNDEMKILLNQPQIEGQILEDVEIFTPIH